MLVSFTVHQNIPQFAWQNILQYFLLIYSSSYNIENNGCPDFPQFWNELDLHEKCCNKLQRIVVAYSYSVIRAFCNCTKKGALIKWSIDQRWISDQLIKSINWSKINMQWSPNNDQWYIFQHSILQHWFVMQWG